MHKKISDRLVEEGELLFSSRKKQKPFTSVKEANALLNDLKNYPHAFVLGCIMDRQIKAEKAWLIPYYISERTGSFSMSVLSSLPQKQVLNLMSKPEPLHRFSETMSGFFYSGIQRIKKQYGGDASKIWSGEPSSAEIIFRYLEFDGVGPKIASMATNILARDFKIPMADYYAIDISADVHVRRVFHRLGLCGENPSVDQVVYKAKALHPEFPGLMDLPCWEIGRKWCKPNNPLCAECFMNGLCPSAKNG